MKAINIYVENQEFDELYEFKKKYGHKSWRSVILTLMRKESEVK